MEMNDVQRASSAGYRLPVRNNETGPVRTASTANRTQRTEGEAKSSNPDKSDRVKQDEAWKEFVRSERRGIREWEKNWGFLKNYDPMGQLKPEEPLPNHMSPYSDHVPNTSNKTYGSRLSTPLGCELVRLDRLIFQTSHCRCQQDPEMLSS